MPQKVYTVHIYIYLVLYSTRNALIYIVIYVIKAGKPMRFLKIPEYRKLFVTVLHSIKRYYNAKPSTQTGFSSRRGTERSWTTSVPTPRVVVAVVAIVAVYPTGRWPSGNWKRPVQISRGRGEGGSSLPHPYYRAFASTLQVGYFGIEDRGGEGEGGRQTREWQKKWYKKSGGRI